MYILTGKNNVAIAYIVDMLLHLGKGNPVQCLEELLLLVIDTVYMEIF